MKNNKTSPNNDKKKKSRMNSLIPGFDGMPLNKKAKYWAADCIRQMKTLPDDMKDKSQEKVVLHTVKSKEKKPVPVGIIFTVIVFSLLLSYMLFDFVRINEFTLEVAAISGELEDLKTEKAKLTKELDEKTDLIAIEKRAKELGMVKKDQVDKEHINTEDEDKIEVQIERKDKQIGGVLTLMNSLSEKFRNIMEYIN